MQLLPCKFVASHQQPQVVIKAKKTRKVKKADNREEMADVAKEIFLHRGYGYVADIAPKERIANVDLALTYAESLCRCGKVREALDVYETCARVTDISVDRLKLLAASVLDSVLAATTPPPPRNAPGVCNCGICEGVLVQPVTLPCGHTFCRRCLARDKTRVCRSCGACHPASTMETDILVKNLVEKLWPVDLEAARLREEGNQLLSRGGLDQALDKYNKSLSLVGDNHLTLSNRSHTLCQLGYAEAALADANQVTLLRPLWGKGHYRRGNALLAMGHTESALTSFCVCVALNRNAQALLHDVAKVLHQILLKQRERHKNKNSPFSTPRTKTVRRDRYFHSLSNPGSDDEQSGGEEDFLPPLTRVDLPMMLRSVIEEVERLKGAEEYDSSLTVNPNLVQTTDFDCVLCCRTLWRPVTTPCGHTYCRVCLDRCLDYSSSCPLCVKSLSEYLISPKIENEFLERCLRSLLPEECLRRQVAHQAEVSELVLSQQDPYPRVPIFVCTTAFPTVHCPLFIFEPRYRLMLRRCVESGACQFGIAACFTMENGIRRYADFGTMLEIRDWVLLSDGCSILSTLGTRRFRVRARGEHDGYDTASVEYISDTPVALEALPSLRNLHSRVRAAAQVWVSTLSPEFRDQVYSSFGEMPSLEEDWPQLNDGPSWAWWLLAILPLGPQLQVSILGTTSLDKRLRAIEKTLHHISNTATTSSQPPQPNSTCPMLS